MFKCNDCGNIATRVYSVFIESDEVLPSFSTPGERKIISLSSVGGGIRSDLVAQWLER